MPFYREKISPWLLANKNSLSWKLKISHFTSKVASKYLEVEHGMPRLFSFPTRVISLVSSSASHETVICACAQRSLHGRNDRKSLSRPKFPNDFLVLWITGKNLPGSLAPSEGDKKTDSRAIRSLGLRTACRSIWNKMWCVYECPCVDVSASVWTISVVRLKRTVFNAINTSCRISYLWFDSLEKITNDYYWEDWVNNTWMDLTEEAQWGWDGAKRWQGGDRDEIIGHK